MSIDSFDLLGVLFFVALGWFWYSSLRVREAAIVATKAACHAEGLLLLDDTVSVSRLRLERDGQGALRLRRLYAFEYSDTGNDRHTGTLVMVGSRVLVISLDLPEGHDRPAPFRLH